MGTTTVTKEYWTPWRLPGSVTQYKESGQSSWIDLSDMKTDNTSHWAYCSSSAAINSSHASPKIYCWDFGFSSIVPSDASIKEIEVKVVCQDGSGYQGQIRDKLITLKTSDNVTNEGWASDYNYAPNTWSGNQSISTFITSKIADGTGPDLRNTNWGPSPIYAAHVRNSNFGCVYQCVGTGSNYRRARIYNIQMRVKYAVTTVVSVTGDYEYTLSVSPSVVNEGDSVTVSVTARNTNNVTDTPPTLTLGCTKGLWSNMSSVLEFTFPSIPAGGSKTQTYIFVTTGSGDCGIGLFDASGPFITQEWVLVEATSSPVYSATITSPSSLKVGETGTYKIVISNTNNTSGTVEAITISSNDKLKINNTNSFQIPAFNLSSGGSKTYTYTVSAVKTGTGTISSSSNSFGTKTNNVTVNANNNITVSCNTQPFTKNEAKEVTVDFNNTSTSSIDGGTVNYTLSSGFVFKSNNSTSLSQSLGTINANGTVTKTINIQGNVVGTGTLTIEIPNTGKTQTFNLNCINPATYTATYLVDKTTCETGEQFTITCTLANTNNTAGKTPVTTIILPNGVTTLNGQSSYSFPAVDCAANGTITRTISVVTLTSGEKQLLLGDNIYTITVTDPVVQAEPVFSTNWAYLTKTLIRPNETSQLVVQYNVVNGSYPATVPETTITILGDSVTFTDNSISKTIPSQTLNEDESYSNLNSGQLFLKFKGQGTSTVKITNSLLGEQNLTISSQYIGPIFTSNANVTPQIIEHTTDGAMVNVTIRTANSGDQQGNCTGSTISLTGGVLEFEDGTTSKVLASRNINPGQENTETITIRTREPGTGNINISNTDSSFNSNFQVNVEAPAVPEYNYSVNAVSPSIPVWGDDHVSTQVKITFTNNNNVAGNTPGNLVLYLSSGLTFADGTSSIEIPALSVERNGKVVYTVPKEVKGNSIGTHRIVLADSETDFEKASTTINIRGATPTNKGFVNIVDCKFIENKAAKGGAICNYGRVLLRNVEYSDNESTSQCNNTYDNGVCL